MLQKLHKDVSRAHHVYELSKDMHSPQLKEYYFIMTEEQMRAGHSQQYQFDEKGIPIIPSYIDIAERSMLYYPISIGQYGLAIWHTYLQTKLETDKNRFLQIAKWFYDNRIEDAKLGAYWLTNVDKPAYGIKKPWKSAFAQARGINILMRAFQITGREEYEKISVKALKPFLFSVKEGGVTTFLKEGPFYEEYPAGAPVLVLNGMIFSLCGVHDFIRTHPEHSEALEIFEKGVACLEKILPRYDMGYWSKYSLCDTDFHPKVDPSTIHYHNIHIIQLKLLYRLSGKEIFQEIAERWNNQITLVNVLKMYHRKYSALKKMKRL